MGLVTHEETLGAALLPAPGGSGQILESGETECASWQTGDMLPLLRCEPRHVT